MQALADDVGRHRLEPWQRLNVTARKLLQMIAVLGRSANRAQLERMAEPELLQKAGRRPPDDLPDVPRSPTGRVPQWVLDEGRGKPKKVSDEAALDMPSVSADAAT